MNFSIIFPSNRFEWLEAVIDSIYDNAQEPNKLEVIVGIDSDNERTIIACKRSVKKYKTVRIKIANREKLANPKLKFVGIVPYINWLYTFSVGKYIMPMNDDALFISKNWDINAFNRLEEFAKDNRIVLGRTEDFMLHEHGFDGSKSPICSFPFISREGIDSLGYLFSPQFYHNTADAHITYVYDSMKRMVDLRDIVQISHRPDRLVGFRFLNEERYRDIKEQIIKERKGQPI